METLNKILNDSLGKIRISDRNKQGIDNEVREMLQDKRKLRKETNLTTDPEKKNRYIEKRKNLENKIKKKIGENEEEKITEMTKQLSDKKNNNKELWKLKRKIQTKQSCAFAVRNKEGDEITSPEGIKKRVSEYYVELYENNNIKEGYEQYHENQERFIKKMLGPQK